MTPQQITEAAQRNHAARLAQIARLQPTKRLAAARADELQAAIQGAKEVRKDFETLQTLRHIPGFFPTPAPIIARMLNYTGNLSGRSVLEPSAGKGNIARAAMDEGAAVQCVEYNFTLCELLRKAGYNARCCDFLSVAPDELPRFDVVMMNPPFNHGTDVKHIRHAHQFLRDGGTLVAVATSTGSAKLRDWAEGLGGEVEPLLTGSFAMAERSTAVNTCLVYVPGNN